MSDSISTTEKNLLKSAWIEAVQEESRSTTPTLAPFRGVNLRLDLLKALKATWETIKVAAKIKLAAYTAPDLATILEIGVESISAAQAIYEALVQKMRPIDYVAYVVLSQKPEGMLVADLKSAVDDFLDNRDDYEAVSWCLRISRDRLDRARQARQGRWMDTVLDKLSECDMIGREGDLITFKSRNFSFRWQPD